MVEIRKTVKDRISLPFEAMAKAALPRNYELSLVICGDALASRMNREYRNKTYSPNVLSFPLSKTEGEIFLNIRKAEREAGTMGIPVKKRLALLFVHGCLHLGGLDHGGTMERAEERILRMFGFW